MSEPLTGWGRTPQPIGAILSHSRGYQHSNTFILLMLEMVGQREDAVPLPSPTQQGSRCLYRKVERLYNHPR